MIDWPKLENILIYKSMPYIIVALIVIGILALIGLVIHVEYSTHRSWIKIFISVLLFSLSFGFAFHFLFIVLGV
ncbi:MAG: hypothetical protein ACTSYM_04585 [Candidatus Baldrarchaeia archaeon]